MTWWPEDSRPHEFRQLKELNGLTRVDGKRPDVSMLAHPLEGPQTIDYECHGRQPAGYFLYVDATSRSAGTAAELAASRKSAKYANLEQSYIL